MQALKFSVKVITKIQTAASRDEIILKIAPKPLAATLLAPTSQDSRFANREFIQLIYCLYAI